MGGIFLHRTAVPEELIEILEALGIPDFDPVCSAFLKNRRETP
jgi:hypothetical protein